MRAPAGYRDVVPLAGGHADETFTGISKHSGERVVLRIFGVGDRHRGPEAPRLQAAVMDLVRGLVPVPDVVEVREGLLVTRFVPGRQLSLVLDEAGADLQRRLGHSVGEVLGRMTNIATLGAGCYLDEKLAYGPWEEGAESLVTWFDRMAARPAAGHWGADERRALRALAERGDALLRRHPRAVHTHGDFSARNVLVEGDRVSAVVDWEFARRGHPLEDLGRLLRARDRGAFVEAVLETVIAWLPPAERDTPAEIRQRARAADFYWLLENGTQDRDTEATGMARGLLRLMAESEDFVPPRTP